MSREGVPANYQVEDGSAMPDKTYEPAAMEARRYSL
jgi:hypothetical protein